MSAAILLDERLDFQALAPLAAQLAAPEAGELVIDASRVRHIGALALQLLIAAVRTRADAGLATRISGASDSCVDQLALFGFSPESLGDPEAWA